MAKDDLSKLKSSVGHLEQNTENVETFTTHEPDDRGAALNALERLKQIARNKMDAGFILQRIPIHNGFREVWVKP